VQADLIGKAQPGARPTLFSSAWALLGAGASITAAAAVGGLGPVLALWAGGFCLLGFIDAKRMLVPTPLVRAVAFATAPGLVAVGLARGNWGPAVSGLVVAGLAALVYGSVAFKFPGKLGFGDVRLASLLGLGLGAVSPEAAVTALVVGPLVAGLYSRRRNGLAAVPLGPFLAAAALVCGFVVGAAGLGRGAAGAR
jgi:leader peptidase (prepilin peptidase)/N-methyltransferase